MEFLQTEKGQMAKCEKILIAGFSGSGKTSLLKVIARTAPPEWTLFEDLDQLILREQQVFPDIAALINFHGWEKFRLWESEQLEKWLKRQGSGVLALGGGSLTKSAWSLYGQSSDIRFSYLKAPFQTCWERLNQQGEELRPLLVRGKTELRKLYTDRVSLYSHIEWQINNNGTQTLEELAVKFWQELLKDD
jgi:shikimate kinase